MQTNLLLENAFPEEVNGVKIYADFRNMVRFSCALNDENLKPHEQIAIGIMQLFSNVPQSVPLLKKRSEELMWFFLGPKRCCTQKQAGNNFKSQKQSQSRAYDFNSDAPLIYSSFLQAYNIRLSKVSFMHWWEFLILLEHLPQNTPMAQLMALRTMDTSDIEDKKARAKLENIRRTFLLSYKEGKTQNLTQKQREDNMKNRIDLRFKQAQKLL